MLSMLHLNETGFKISYHGNVEAHRFIAFQCCCTLQMTCCLICTKSSTSFTVAKVKKIKVLKLTQCCNIYLVMLQ